MTKPQPIAETIGELSREIHKLEAEIVADRSKFSHSALAAVRAPTPEERTEANAAAAAANGRVQENRIIIEGLKIALEQAREQLQGERVLNARAKLREALQQGGVDLKMRTAATLRAQKLLREASAAIAEVVYLGTKAHGQFRQFLSADQSASIDPDESALAYAVMGELLRAGAIKPGALESLSGMGLSGLFSFEKLTAVVEHQNLLMSSRFDAALLAAPEGDAAVEAKA